jgi:predicted DNA-binding protein (MmcQ/YjbR family)
MDGASIDRFCRTLPRATRVVQWEGVIVFKVGGRMFCMLPPRERKRREAWFKADDAHYDALKDAPGFRPCPYLARARWVAVAEPEALEADMLKAYLRRAHQVIAARLPRKTQLELGFTPPPRATSKRRSAFDEPF